MSEQKMKYVRVGKSGLKVSKICLGCMSYGSSEWRKWVLDEPESKVFIKRALELGINFFDTANAYSLGKSEEVLGNALREFAPGKRSEHVIASKVYVPMNDKPNGGGLSRKHIMDSVEQSLRRLGTDYLDIYQFHRWDPETPLEETIDTLHDLLRAGKIRYVGGSSCYAWQFSKAVHMAKERGFNFISMQNHYNLIYREEEREMNPFCNSEGIGLIPWSPLARGLLSGKWKRTDKSIEGETIRAETDAFSKQLYTGTRDNDFDIIERVVELANKKKVTPSQLSLAWMMNKPGVAAPIIGATKMSHLEEAVAAVHIEVTPEEMKYLEELYKPHPISGHQ